MPNQSLEEYLASLEAQRSAITIQIGGVRLALGMEPEDHPCITKAGATHYVTMVTADMDNMEKKLIVEMQPSCNKKVG